MQQAFKKESKKITDSGQYHIQKQTKVRPLLVDFSFLKPADPIFCKLKFFLMKIRKKRFTRGRCSSATASKLSVVIPSDVFSRIAFLHVPSKWPTQAT